jgi:putative endonuclease
VWFTAVHSRTVGGAGEACAADFFRRQGWKLVRMNYVCAVGEIDLIVQKGDILSFVEVKTRRATSVFGNAEWNVDSRKIEKLRAAAEVYLHTHPSALQPRVDVVHVLFDDVSGYQVKTWIPNALD